MHFYTKFVPFAALAGLVLASASHTSAQLQSQGLYQPAAAASSNYGRISVDMINGSGEIDELSYTHIGVRGGRMFAPNFGGEVRLGTALSADEVDVGGMPVEVELNITGAALGRAQMNTGVGITPYVALGIGGYKASTSNSTHTEVGVAGFLGADYRFNNGLAVGAEFGTVTGDANSLGINFGMDF